jgi:outer membrane lipoprotein SlyB
MQKLWLTIAIAASIALLPGVSNAHGCLKGAAVGGVVGHVAGHHAVAGAAAGCVIGHHRAKVNEREAAAARPQDNAARPAGATPAR